MSGDVEASAGAKTPSGPVAAQGAVLAALERIEARLDRLERGASQHANDAVAILADTVDSWVLRAADRGIDVDDRAHQLARVAERLTSREALELLCGVLDRVDALQHLLDSGVLDPGPTAMVARAGRAVADAAATTPPALGPIALTRSLWDPDVRRAMGLLVDVARRLGRSLEDSPVTARLGEGANR